MRFQWFVLLAVACSLICGKGYAVKPTPDEMAAFRDWVKTQCAMDSTPLPFSFVYDGTPMQEFLNATKPVAEERKLDAYRLERVFTWRHAASGLDIRIAQVEYTDFPVIEWVLELHHSGAQDTGIIERVEPLDVGLATNGAPATLHYALGDSNSAQSFAPVEQVLTPGQAEPFVLAPKGGRSSDGFMPFFNLAYGERQGAVIAIGWSGQWQARFQHSSSNAVHVQAGMEQTHFRLHPGETVRTPRILVLLWKGEDPLRGNNLFRQFLMAHCLPRRNGEIVFPPLCASVTETDPDGSYEGPHIRVMEPLAQRGIEVFWSDMDPQQWYPGGFPDGTGTWEPDPAKYPRGLKPIGEAAHAAGLGYLLWFEPERVAANSRIAKERPEWVTGGEKGGLFKLHLPEARQWLTDYVDVQVNEAKLDWMRWDFNIEPLKYWRENDAPDRQGITEMKHIEGLYAMWDDLMQRHPGMLIDLCASGGRRIDIESLHRGLPLWHSDLQCSGPHPAADQLQNGGLFRWVPLHGCGVFAYENSYVFRSAMTGGDILAVGGAKGPLGTADPDTEAQVKRTVAICKKIRPYLLGDFYPLFPHNPGEDAWYGYQFHREDLNAGVVMMFRREKCTESSTSVPLHAIKPSADYAMTFADTDEKKSVTGQALSALRVEIASSPGATLLYYHEQPK